MIEKSIAISVFRAPPRTKPSNYPEPYRSMMIGRVKRPLGDLFGLTNFGVNLVVVPPSAVSALRHAHSRQDEFVYVVSGKLVLHTNEGEMELSAGMCAGFSAGQANAHRLLNTSNAEAVYLEVGDRSPGDSVEYPDDDLKADLQNGNWIFTHKDGTPYS